MPGHGTTNRHLGSFAGGAEGEAAAQRTHTCYIHTYLLYMHALHTLRIHPTHTHTRTQTRQSELVTPALPCPA